ncbi:MAG: endonuclease VIII [Proteobacteria bacterium]|nr:endonuclease VIII [Pseudomonadota bacterium]
MAERPDLDYAIPRLREAVCGRVVETAAVLDPVVLRLMERGTLESLVEGHTIEGVERRAQFAQFLLSGGRSILVAPMLAGRFALGQKGKRRRKDTVVVVTLDDGVELRYRDDVRMGKVYVCQTDAWSTIPGLQQLGLDPLDPATYTLEAFTKRIRKHRNQVRLFLMDKSQIDALGNAYADEVLFAAKLHPKLRCNKLTTAQIASLHAAVRDVLTSALQTLEERQPALDIKLRDFLKVRNRKGEPCPVCETSIRVAGVRGYDSFFCPSCQPSGGGGGLVDWSKLRGKRS